MADFLVAHLGHGDTPAELTPQAEALLSLAKNTVSYARSFIEALGSSFPAAVSSCMSHCPLVKTFRDCKGRWGLLSAAAEQVASDAVMQPACTDTCTGLRQAHAQGEDILCGKRLNLITSSLAKCQPHQSSCTRMAYGPMRMGQRSWMSRTVTSTGALSPRILVVLLTSQCWPRLLYVNLFCCPRKLAVCQ